MKKILIAILACTFILSSCTNADSPSSQSSQSSESSSSSSSSSDASNSLQATPLPAEGGSSSNADTAPIPELLFPKPMVADAAMYRGTISDITDTGFTLAQANGRDFGAATMKFTIDENTKFNIEEANLKAGMYIEAYYGAAMGKATDYTAVQAAIQVNMISDDVNMSVYNGEVISIDYKEGSKDEGSILMKPLDSINTNETVFLFGNNTQFYMNKDDIKVGAKLHIYRSSVETRSLPPQTQAYEISLYEELSIK